MPSGGAILPPDGMTPANLSSTSLSVHSSARDRHNITTHSCESWHTAVDQPSQLATATDDEPGQGQDAFQSRERQSRSPSPTDHLYDRIIPAVSPAVPPSLTSVVVDVHNPTTEPLPTSSSTNSQRLTDESYVVGSPATHYPPLHATAEESSQHLPPTPPIIPDIHSPEGCTLRLMHSDEIPRYTMDVKIPRVKTFCKIRPLTRTFPYFQEQSHSDQPPINQDCNPWVPATHPDGALYFFDRERRLFTDADMYNSLFREEIEEFYRYLQNILRADQLTIPSNNYDLVLHVMPIGPTRKQWSYYYACHETRCLFWLHMYDATDMVSEVYGVNSPAHIKHRLEALYWTHWFHYPVIFGDRSLPDSVCDELIGILSYGCAEKITSIVSPVPFGVDALQKMIELVKNAKEAHSSLEYHVAGIVRFLELFSNWGFIDFHGQPHARFTRSQTVYNEPKRERSLRFKLLSLLLFLAPNNYLRDMEILWTDGYAAPTGWESFMNELLQEWTDVLLPSTVMLSVTVSFLAIPGIVLSNLNGSNVTNPSQVIIFTSPAQIASTLSIVASVGSIVIDLLVRYTNTKPKASSAGPLPYQYERSQRLFGNESMAIVFSLPWALLMWSMVLFSIALLLSCFTHSNASTRISVTVMSVIVACLTVWSTLTTWRSDADWEVVYYKYLFVLKRAGDKILTSVKHFALGIFRPRSPRAYPTPHSLVSTSSIPPVTEDQDRSA
ncbi:hypothetical protein BJV78DRAFT_241690 [Lactifluus subvellereus]|nr:hypothetical protein BJV78DRAFT_241690 [Lactifluus subvellereus]